MRQLVVNADDFGFTEGVNRGIVDAMRKGILRATTLMANGAAFDHAVALANDNPALDVGVHGVLIQGEMLTKRGRRLPSTLSQFLIARRTWLTRTMIRAELEAQIDKIRQAGIEPTHIDMHKHTHVAPDVLKVVLDLAEDHGIRWVRTPYDIPRLVSAWRLPTRALLLQPLLRSTERRFRTTIRQKGVRATDHFAGFALTGNLATPNLLRLLPKLPEGSTELMAHPGYNDAELNRARTRLTWEREVELKALMDPTVAEAAAAAGIEICSFADLN